MEIITAEIIDAFAQHLRNRELAPGTIENYLRHVRAFIVYLDGLVPTKELVAEWRKDLLTNHTAETVNGMLVSLNSFFHFIGREDCVVKLLRVQHKAYRDESRELTQEEYRRLLDAANRMGKERLALMMETICGIGLRVSELRYITVEAARAREAEISMKGKVRRIIIPDKLAKKLLKYAKKNKITSGPIFLTATGRPLSRRQIWAEMKALCKAAGVESTKVFPHNLRHLFARTFYRVSHDIAHLADVLGHSSINTTRIYLISTGDEHRRQLERLGLVT